MARNILHSSLQNASFSIVCQVLFRCITFVLNAFIIRTVGHDVLGIMNVRLLLLESTISFLSKEPLLKACLTDVKSHNWAQVMNQIWISVPISALLSLFFMYIWIHILSPVEEIYQNQYAVSCFLMASSCVIEQGYQNVALVAQSFCFVKLKIVFETLYVVIRTSIFVCMVIYKPDESIYAFGVAQVVSAVFLCFSYYIFFTWYIRELRAIRNGDKIIANVSLFDDMTDFPFKSIWDFFPGILKNDDGVFNKDLCLLTASFTKQSVVKQVLTEGEKYVMTLSPVMTFSQQSMYDIVNNLGSLAARFIFRPIEESSYFYFTQMIKRNIPLNVQDKNAISESVSVLKQLCSFILSFGLLILVFGQHYSYTLLYLYGGEKLVENVLPVTLLRCHCLAVVLLGVNGITEGFVFATMSNEQLDRYNYVMVIFSLVFLLVSYLLTRILGPVGFIIANCVNMLTRIIHSLNYISKKYKGTFHKPFDSLKPSKLFTIFLLLSGISTKLSEVYLMSNSLIGHIFVGFVFFAATVIVWGYENKHLLKIGYEKYKRRYSTKEE